MNLDEQLTKYKNETKAVPLETDIEKTIKESKDCFINEEAERTLTYRSFLYYQFRLIRKKWWVFQLLVLAALWAIIPAADDILYVWRSMGVGAALFIILIIPELWKNRTSQSMEIETATYFSLKQVYSARIFLFGIVDVAMITIFCAAISVSMRISLTDLLIQFLFPLSVTACICFAVLCSKHFFSESAAVGTCIVWSAIWWFILLNDHIYNAVSIPIWILMLGIAVLFLAFAVYRSVHQCSLIWEGNKNGTKNA